MIQCWNRQITSIIIPRLFLAGIPIAALTFLLIIDLWATKWKGAEDNASNTVFSYNDRVRKIYKKFPQIPVPQHLDLTDDDDMQKLSEALGEAKICVEGCSSFLKAAIKWSVEFGAHRNGSLELHDMLAEYIYSESPEVDMTRVSYHFVRGKHPKTFASTLVNFMGKCYPGEDDLAISRAILMFKTQEQT